MNFENQLECKIADKKHDGELHEGRTESPSHSQSSTISDNNSNNNNISKSDITNKPNGNSRNVPENISCNSSRTSKTFIFFNFYFFFLFFKLFLPYLHKIIDGSVT